MDGIAVVAYILLICFLVWGAWGADGPVQEG